VVEASIGVRGSRGLKIEADGGGREQSKVTIRGKGGPGGAIANGQSINNEIEVVEMESY
jgi:hypothetical protein